MDRHNLDDTNVTLVAVDMRKQTLKGVAGYYSPRPLGYSSVYFGSGISKHLRRTSTRGNAATETSKHETLQFGNQGVPRKNVQSQMSSKKVDGTHCKCRGRRGRCKQADKLEVPGKNDISWVPKLMEQATSLEKDMAVVSRGSKVCKNFWRLIA